MRRIAIPALIALVIALTAPDIGPVVARAAPPDIPALLGEVGVVPIKPVPAPAFSLAGLDGKRLALADLKGRPALLYFWASW